MGGPQQVLLSISSIQLPSTGLQFEYRGNDLTAGDGNLITVWDDHAGSNDAVGGTTNRPTQRDNTLHGLPTAQFTDPNSRTLTTPVSAGSNVNFTFYAVMKCSDSNPRTLLAGDGGSPQIRINGNKINLLRATTDDMGSSSTSLSTSAYYTIACSYDGTTVRFYLNGAADGTSVTSKTFVDPVRYVGTRTGNEYFSGFIAHIIFYNAVQSGADTTATFAYLRALWATY